MILFCSSPYEGNIQGKNYDDLDVWSNAYNAALKTCRLASKSLKRDGKLVLVGSIVGYLKTISGSCVPYSVFKGSLSLLVEGFNKEIGDKAHYINLGSFREKADDTCLEVNEVVKKISDIMNGNINNSQVNLMCKNEEEKYI